MIKNNFKSNNRIITERDIASYVELFNENEQSNVEFFLLILYLIIQIDCKHV